MGSNVDLLPILHFAPVVTSAQGPTNTLGLSHQLLFPAKRNGANGRRSRSPRSRSDWNHSSGRYVRTCHGTLLMMETSIGVPVLVRKMLQRSSIPPSTAPKSKILHLRGLRPQLVLFYRRLRLQGRRIVRQCGKGEQDLQACIPRQSHYRVTVYGLM